MSKSHAINYLQYLQMINTMSHCWCQGHKESQGHKEGCSSALTLQKDLKEPPD